MRSNESMRSSAAAYSPSVITRSPTLARVFFASSGESGFGPDEALADAAAVASLFFFEQAPANGIAVASRATASPRPTVLPNAAPRAARSLERIGAGEYYEP